MNIIAKIIKYVILPALLMLGIAGVIDAYFFEYIIGKDRPISLAQWISGCVALAGLLFLRTKNQDDQFQNKNKEVEQKQEKQSHQDDQFQNKNKEVEQKQEKQLHQDDQFQNKNKELKRQQEKQLHYQDDQFQNKNKELKRQQEKQLHYQDDQFQNKNKQLKQRQKKQLHYQDDQFQNQNKKLEKQNKQFTNQEQQRQQRRQKNIQINKEKEHFNVSWQSLAQWGVSIGTIAGGAWLFFRRVKNQDKQIDIQIKKEIDDRFNAAVQLLGNSETSARTGGIYSLYQLIIEPKAEKYRVQVAQILCSHIRSKTQEPEYQKLHRDRPSNEIQTAIDILFRNINGIKGIYQQDFSQANNFPRADLSRAHLQGANFRNAHCQEADFGRAQLQGASFGEADCQKTNFTEAQCQGTDFTHAHCQGANFTKTDC